MGWESSHITNRAAYRFTGQDYFETPANDSLDQTDNFSYGFMIIPGRADCSIAARILPTGDPLDPTTCAMFIESVNFFLTLWLHDSVTGKTLKATTVAPVLNTANIVDFEIVRSNTNKTLVIYRDGVSIPYSITATPTTTFLATLPELGSLPILPSSVVRFAYSVATKNNFNGKVFDIRFFDKARSSVDVDGYYESIKPLTQPSPNGAIIFSSQRNNALWNIYTMDGDGRNQAPVILADDNLLYPSWSKEPGQGYFTFTANKVAPAPEGSGFDNGIWRANKSGGQKELISTGDASSSGSVFSNNNTYIYYLGNNYNLIKNLWRITNPLSGVPVATELTNNNSNPATKVTASPDGTFILATQDSTDYYTEVFKIPVSSTGVLGTQQIIFSGATASSSSAISPNSQLIAVGISTAFQEGRSSQVFLFDKDGGSPKQLTGIAGYCSVWAFSPDNTKVLFSVTINGKRQLCTIDINGRNMKNISSNNFSDDFADWK